MSLRALLCLLCLVALMTGISAASRFPSRSLSPSAEYTVFFTNNYLTDGDTKDIYGDAWPGIGIRWSQQDGVTNVDTERQSLQVMWASDSHPAASVGEIVSSHGLGLSYGIDVLSDAGQGMFYTGAGTAFSLIKGDVAYNTTAGQKEFTSYNGLVTVTGLAGMRLGAHLSLEAQYAVIATTFHRGDASSSELIGSETRTYRSVSPKIAGPSLTVQYRF